MTKAIRGRITRVEHLGTSNYGNPYFRVDIETADGETVTLRTKINAMINHEITNPTFREREHTFKLTPAGRISGREYKT